MSGIPLVQDNGKDAINTSIIAIKRALERINQLLGLSDSGGSNPDLSGLATKQELQNAVNSLQPVDEVTLNNMQSVTSNAVAKKMSGWKMLVEFQNGGSFTVPEDAVEVNINIGANTQDFNGSATLIMASMANITSFIVSCNNNQRSIFSVTDNGRTFTNTGGDYKYMTVYYR